MALLLTTTTPTILLNSRTPSPKRLKTPPDKQYDKLLWMRQTLKSHSISSPGFPRPDTREPRSKSADMSHASQPKTTSSKHLSRKPSITRTVSQPVGAGERPISKSQSTYDQAKMSGCSKDVSKSVDFRPKRELWTPELSSPPRTSSPPTPVHAGIYRSQIHVNSAPPSGRPVGSQLRVSSAVPMETASSLRLQNESKDLATPFTRSVTMSPTCQFERVDSRTQSYRSLDTDYGALGWRSPSCNSDNMQSFSSVLDTLNPRESPECRTDPRLFCKSAYEVTEELSVRCPSPSRDSVESTTTIAGGRHYTFVAMPSGRKLELVVSPFAMPSRQRIAELTDFSAEEQLVESQQRYAQARAYLPNKPIEQYQRELPIKVNGDEDEEEESRHNVCIAEERIDADDDRSNPIAEAKVTTVSKAEAAAQRRSLLLRQKRLSIQQQRLRRASRPVSSDAQTIGSGKQAVTETHNGSITNLSCGVTVDSTREPLPYTYSPEEVNKIQNKWAKYKVSPPKGWGTAVNKGKAVAHLAKAGGLTFQTEKIPMPPIKQNVKQAGKFAKYAKKIGKMSRIVKAFREANPLRKTSVKSIASSTFSDRGDGSKHRKVSRKISWDLTSNVTDADFDSLSGSQDMGKSSTEIQETSVTGLRQKRSADRLTKNKSLPQIKHISVDLGSNCLDTTLNMVVHSDDSV